MQPKHPTQVVSSGEDQRRLRVPGREQPLHVQTHDRGAVIGPLAHLLLNRSDFTLECGFPRGAGWVYAGDLVSPDPHSLNLCLDRIMARQCSDDVQLAASRLLRSYTWHITAVATAWYLTEGCVPDVSTENLAVRFDEHGEVSGLALLAVRYAVPTAHTPRSATSCGTWLRRWLWDRLIDGHLVALIQVLSHRTQQDTDVLWADVVAACAGVFHWFDQVLVDVQQSGDTPHAQRPGVAG